MHNLLLQSDVTVPSTTTGQYTIAAFVTLALLILAVVLYRRSKVLGLDAENRQAREEARAQRRRTAAAELKLSVDTVADLSSGELRQRLLDLFDTDAEATVTRLPAVVKRIAGAVDEAWGDRVGWLPTLARRAIGLASMVVVFGAVAVSGNAVVALLRSDPSTPGPESFVDTVTTGARSAVDIVGSYPYAGTFWELGYASLIISVQWLYEQWALVAIALVVSAVSIILLTHRLDDEAIPERLVQSPRLAAGAILVTILAVWAAGVVPVLLASAIGPVLVFGIAVVPLLVGLSCLGLAFVLQGTKSTRLLYLLGGGFTAASLFGASWGAVAGLWTSLLVAGVAVVTIGPIALARLRRGVRQVAGADARPAAAFLVIHRVLAGLSVMAGGFVLLYVFAGVENGQWAAVLSAAATAEPEVQLLLGAAVMALVGLTAVALREAWPTVREEIRAAVTQQAVRAKLLGRGIRGSACSSATCSSR